jgi:6-phosphofructokinase 1
MAPKDISVSTTTALVLTFSAVSAWISCWLTRRSEERKVLEEKREVYDRELMIKSKTLEARKLLGEPSGKVIADVHLDRIFLWEVEDLKSRFPSSKIPNVMQNSGIPNMNPYFFPSLRQSVSTGSEDGVRRESTNYNRLITNHECILADIVRKPNMQTFTHAYVRAGPRRYLHFKPETVNAAIVTCGGLCPGLNNVIREITKTLLQSYGIGGTVYGIQGGFRGFYDFENYQPIELTTELVQNIHHEGGTVLGSSRGGFDLEKILDFLESKKISQLFVIGGDGTHRGAFRVHEGCMERVSASTYTIHHCRSLGALW